jgi:adenosylcobinamide amidohydrolase
MVVTAAVAGVDSPLLEPCEGPAFAVERQGRWLLARFTAAQRMLSFAIIRGGLAFAKTVAWYQVIDEELRPPTDPRQLLRQRLAEAALPNAVGLLTSRSLSAYVDVVKDYGPLSARCIATVGLGNALSIGDLPGPSARIGTINLLCHVSAPLSEEALVEALSLAAEARTAAVLSANVQSLRTGRPATGTGTDCIVMAAPAFPEGAPYAGKHTPLGYVIGASVFEAVRRGAMQWKEERAR